MLFLGSANRDEERFSDPDVLDLYRSECRILSFGRGIHACLGGALARMEGQVAFVELARRHPELQLKTASFERTLNMTFLGFKVSP
jgi:cytochrome P450